MSNGGRPSGKALVWILVGVTVLVVAPFVVVPLGRHWLEMRVAEASHHGIIEADATARVSFTLDHPETLNVPDDVVLSMGITVAEVEGALPVEPLKLDGSLFLDANSMVHVRSRFAGEVVEVGELLPAVTETLAETAAALLEESLPQRREVGSAGSRIMVAVA